MNVEDADALLASGARVRVWDAQHSAVFAEGRVIAYQTQPSIIVEDDEGNRTTWMVTLPIEVQHIEWRPV